jgi:hypothetical protein
MSMPSTSGAALDRKGRFGRRAYPFYGWRVYGWRAGMLDERGTERFRHYQMSDSLL